MPDTTKSSLRLIGALGAGALVSVALGVYGRTHDPTFEAAMTFGFSTQLQMKAWLAMTAAGLACVILATALRLYRRVGSGAIFAALIGVVASSAMWYFAQDGPTY